MCRLIRVFKHIAELLYPTEEYRAQAEAFSAFLMLATAAPQEGGPS